jgi:hypothetical protein
MNMPQPKHNVLFEQIAAVLAAGKKPDALTTARLSRACDELLKTHPEQAYVAHMLVAAASGKRQDVIAFGKKAWPLIDSSDSPVTLMHNFLCALQLQSIVNEWSISKCIDKMLAWSTEEDDKMSAAEMAFSFGLPDTAQSILKGLEQNTRLLYLPEFIQTWVAAKCSFKADERELSRLQGIAGAVFCQILKRPIQGIRYEIDMECGFTFSVFYAPNDVESDDLIDACWEIERVLENEPSQLLNRVIFTIRHY